MGELSNTTINGVSYDFKDAGAARQSHSHTKSQITDFPTSMPASDVAAWAKASSKPSYTQDEVGDGTTYKRVTSTEKNTWNSKGSYSKPSGGIPKTDLASAVQTSLGLADTSLQHTTVSGSPDLDTYLTTGVYHITTSTATHAPTTNHATLFVDATVGTPYQIFKPDNVDSPWYTRHRSGSSWTAWAAMKFTDTTYSAATTSAAGLMSAADKTKLDGIATGANNYTHPTTDGNKHIPSGGSRRQILVYGGSSGTAEWGGLIHTGVYPSKFFNPASGYSVNESNACYCDDQHLFGTIDLSCTTTGSTLGTIKTNYLPKWVGDGVTVTGIALIQGSSTWSVAYYDINTETGTVTISGGSPVSGKHVKLMIDYLLRNSI